jgi:hypothetical protein
VLSLGNVDVVPFFPDSTNDFWSRVLRFRFQDPQQDEWEIRKYGVAEKLASSDQLELWEFEQQLSRTSPLGQNWFC